MTPGAEGRDVVSEYEDLRERPLTIDEYKARRVMPVGCQFENCAGECRGHPRSTEYVHPPTCFPMRL